MTRNKVSHAGLVLALSLSLLAPATAAAGSQTARLKVALNPERLGGRTTIIFSFRILPHGESVPSPLVAMTFSIRPTSAW